MFYISFHQFTKLVFNFLHYTPPPLENYPKHGGDNMSCTMPSDRVVIPLIRRKNPRKISPSRFNRVFPHLVQFTSHERGSRWSPSHFRFDPPSK